MFEAILAMGLCVSLLGYIVFKELITKKSPQGLYNQNNNRTFAL